MKRRSRNNEPAHPAAEQIPISQLLGRNQRSIARLERSLDRVRTAVLNSDDLIRQADWKCALSDLRSRAMRNLWQTWVAGNDKGSTARSLAYVLDLAMEMTEADYGNVQLFDPAHSGLRIALSRGLDREFLDYFKVVRSSKSACGAAMRNGSRVVVSDVRTDSNFSEASRQILLRAGIISVQSTPLISPTGSVLGMLSTHACTPGIPPPSSMPFLDQLARRTARMLA